MSLTTSHGLNKTKDTLDRPERHTDGHQGARQQVMGLIQRQTDKTDQTDTRTDIKEPDNKSWA